MDCVAASRGQTVEERRRPSKEGLQAAAPETGLCSHSHTNQKSQPFNSTIAFSIDVGPFKTIMTLSYFFSTDVSGIGNEGAACVSAHLCLSKRGENVVALGVLGEHLRLP